MGIEYYAFALFIAALICLVAILFKILFANVRRRNMLLDEKEAKLLQLYRSVENIMEEFNDQIRTSIDEIKEYEAKAVAHMASVFPQTPASYQREETARPPQQQPQPQAPERAPSRAMTVDSSRIRAAGEVLERAERMIKSGAKKNAAPVANKDNSEVIQRLFDDPAPDAQTEESASDAQALNARRESIIALAEEGRSNAQIAKELGITQNEVKLIIDLNGVANR